MLFSNVVFYYDLKFQTKHLMSDAIIAVNSLTRGMIDVKSMKIKARDWVDSIFNQYALNDVEKIKMDCALYFKLTGFADEPEVYLRSTDEGLELGYKATQWNGPVPAPFPGVYKKHSLSWDTLHSLEKKEQQELVLDLLMKTINFRKRQYRKCQFCGEKVAPEHRFDQNTCHGCASEHFGVVY